MPNQLPNQLPNQPHSGTPLSFGPELAGVPHLNQYWGAWAIDEEYAKFLVSHAQNINLQLHLEQHGAQAAAGNANGYGSLAIDANGIAQIELSGTLMKHCSSMAAGTSLALARRQVRAAANNDLVRGILLVIDSPGGTVAGTADLAADIRAAASKKPLFAYIEDCGASGAYWLASQAQRVAMNATGLAGSIGVFTVVEDTSKAAEKEGVKVHVVRFGAMKGAGTPGTPVTEEQLSYLQERIDGFADDFIGAIASGRKMSREAATKLADGRVHKGEAAKKVGLVDAIESIDETLAALTAEINKKTSSSRTKAMSEQSNADAPKVVTPTLAELREACPGASAEFLLEQIEKSASVAQAMKAHTKVLSDSKAALETKVKELETKAAETAKTPAKPTRGVAPLAAGEGEEESIEFEGGANAFLISEIEAKVAKGIKRDRAAKLVFAAHPTLQQAVVDEANERRKAG